MSPSEKNSSNFVETKQSTNSSLGESAVNTSSNDPLLGKAEIIAQKFNVKDKESLIKKGPTMIWNLLKGDKKFSELNKEDKDIAWKLAQGLFIATIPLLVAEVIIAAPFAIVGFTLLFAVKVAVKAVQSGYKGLKWSAEKTVEGAKHIGGKIKDGYEYSADSLKRGASFVSEKTKEKTSDIFTATADKLYRAAGNENYSDRIDNELIPDSPQKKRIQGVKEDLRAICADEKSNSTLIKSILSGISEKIEEKITEETYLDWRDYLPDQLVDKWREQKKFIDHLDADGLRNLVTKRLSDKDKYFRDSIFSEHHDGIKEVMREWKEEHTRFNTLERLNKSAKRHKASSMNSLKNSLSESSSMDSLSSYSTTSSEAELLNPSEHKEVKAPTSFFGKLFSSKGSKKPEEVTCTGYKRISEDEITSAEIGKPGAVRRNSTGNLTKVSTPKVPTSASLTNLNKVVNSSSQSSFSQDVLNDPTVKQNLNALSSRTLTRSDSVSSLASNSSYSSAISTLSDIDKNIASQSSSFIYHSNSDSGVCSGSSTPQRHSPSQETRFSLEVTEELAEKLAKRRVIVDQPNVESVQQKAEPSKG
ncbi:hypothetical protein [Wolbachia endosymbiont (group B) of Gerris lacustris]|uniref:actin-bundling T4SS effector WalE1 family protein n=1 Tax=Wolbachia endosymbiont (group B) of Gerris lacustris TaxID=3066159 RepID=UPI00333E68D0